MPKRECVFDNDVLYAVISLLTKEQAIIFCEAVESYDETGEIPMIMNENARRAFEWNYRKTHGRRFTEKEGKNNAE